MRAEQVALQDSDWQPLSHPPYTFEAGRRWFCCCLLLKTKPLVLCFNHLRWKLSGSINHLSGLITPTMIPSANSQPPPALDLLSPESSSPDTRFVPALACGWSVLSAGKQN